MIAVRHSLESKGNGNDSNGLFLFRGWKRSVALGILFRMTACSNLGLALSSSGLFQCVSRRTLRSIGIALAVVDRSTPIVALRRYIEYFRQHS